MYKDNGKRDLFISLFTITIVWLLPIFSPSLVEFGEITFVLFIITYFLFTYDYFNYNSYRIRCEVQKGHWEDQNTYNLTNGIQIEFENRGFRFQNLNFIEFMHFGKFLLHSLAFLSIAVILSILLRTSITTFIILDYIIVSLIFYLCANLVIFLLKIFTEQFSSVKKLKKELEVCYSLELNKNNIQIKIFENNQKLLADDYKLVVIKSVYLKDFPIIIPRKSALDLCKLGLRFDLRLVENRTYLNLLNIKKIHDDPSKEILMLNLLESQNIAEISMISDKIKTWYDKSNNIKEIKD